MKLEFTGEFAELDEQLRQIDNAAEAALASSLDVEALLARVKREARSAHGGNAGRQWKSEPTE